MMLLQKLLDILDANPSATLHMVLPDGKNIPAHFHVTEVGLVRKDFVDCGGTRRSSVACVLQVWVAKDLQHRLSTAKLAKILRLAMPILNSTELDMEVEYEERVFAHYRIDDADVDASSVTLRLGSKHTACLAPQLCIVNSSSDAGCEGEGCC